MSTTPIFSFVVHGCPAPQGSKSFKGLSKRGRAILVESSSQVPVWREAVKIAAWQQSRQRKPLDMPVAMRLIFTLRKPSSAPKSHRTWPMHRPDLDKLARCVLDSLVDGGLLIDDSRVVEFLRLAKVFPGEDPDALNVPGVRIKIFRVGD